MSDELDDKPDEETFEKIKALYPNREVARMNLKDSFGSYDFVITSPSKAELIKYDSDCKQAGSDNTKARDVIERTALALIRWPDRAEVQALFERRPNLSIGFAEVINNISGLNMEATLKK